MRISDWSSDVCSSDLLLQFLLQFDSWEGKQHPIERGLASGATRHIIQTIDGHLPNLPPHHFANRCAFFFLGAVVDWENQRAAGRCVEDISQVIDQSLEFIITKSEEHMSEIQSLMRIS